MHVVCVERVVRRVAVASECVLCVCVRVCVIRCWLLGVVGWLVVVVCSVCSVCWLLVAVCHVLCYVVVVAVAVVVCVVVCWLLVVVALVYGSVGLLLFVCVCVWLLWW